MTRQERIAATLRAALSPATLEVIDESHQHAGHAGARPEGETHYRIRIASRQFAGKSRIEMHRIINGLVQPEFDSGLHALAIEAQSG